MAGDRRDRTGEVIDDRFRLDALIGKGAMADVYRALDQSTSAYVAVKILRHELGGDPAARQRFQREGEVQARLRHQNIAALLATGVTKRNEPYLAVELLRGRTLRGVIKAEGALAARRAASYTWQALQGLHEVHNAGILHRDLKPANLMLEPSPGPIERVCLIDFGFASFEGSARLTAQGAIVGSLAYVAPERFHGEKPDHRADLYAIGIMLFEMLRGVPPFQKTQQIELIEQHLHEPAPPLGPEFPATLNAVVARALAKHPADRFPHALAMVTALEGAASEIP